MSFLRKYFPLLLATLFLALFSGCSSMDATGPNGQNNQPWDNPQSFNQPSDNPTQPVIEFGPPWVSGDQSDAHGH
jgi:hypothetical protein